MIVFLAIMLHKVVSARLIQSFSFLFPLVTVFFFFLLSFPGTGFLWIGDFSLAWWVGSSAHPALSVGFFFGSASCSSCYLLWSQPKKQRDPVQCQCNWIRHAIQRRHFFIRFDCPCPARNSYAFRRSRSSFSVWRCRQNWIHSLRTACSCLWSSSSAGSDGIPSSLNPQNGLYIFFSVGVWFTICDFLKTSKGNAFKPQHFNLHPPPFMVI